MKKIVLSALTVATLGTVAVSADTVYKDRNGVLYTTAGEGRVAVEVKDEKVKKDGFWGRFHAKGDLRLRQEVIKKDPDTTTLDKNRERYRFRYGVNVDVTDNILLETAIASGKYNPTSGNVSFNNDDNYNKAQIQDYFIDMLKIDIADIKYSFDNSWLRVGKQAHNIYRPIKTQLVWDNDIRLEGINYGFKDDNSQMRFGVNRVHREKGSKDGSNINIFLGQYVHTLKVDEAKVNLGAAYYHYDGVKGNTDPYGNSDGTASVKGFKGNSYSTAVDAGGRYTEDYQIGEAFVEAQFKDVMGKPFKMALIGAYNFGASDDNIGYDVSAQWGANKKVGDWQVAATYRDVEKDSVFGAHNDSDFSGGGTDSTGYYGKIKYKFAKNVDVQGWWNWSDTKISTGNTVEYYRHQIDVILKF